MNETILDLMNELHHQGFTVTSCTQSPNRLLHITINRDIVEKFTSQVSFWSVQELEYKSFLRFRIAKVLNDLCDQQLQPLISKVLRERHNGALLITPEGLTTAAQAEDMLKFSTALVHLFGRSNHDAMTGQFYARFIVKNDDSSDSYLRQASRNLELHTDGTFVEQKTDFVLIQKIDEQYMVGGRSRLLHLDDWQDLETFAVSPFASENMRWSVPPSKNVTKDIFHPVFSRDRFGRFTMSYIDQFVQPDTFEQGNWLASMSESLEASQQIQSINIPIGSLLLINNNFWLHGRESFIPHPLLRRELMRQRGFLNDE